MNTNFGGKSKGYKKAAEEDEAAGRGLEAFYELDWTRLGGADNDGEDIIETGFRHCEMGRERQKKRKRGEQ